MESENGGAEGGGGELKERNWPKGSTVLALHGDESFCKLIRRTHEVLMIYRSFYSSFC